MGKYTRKKATKATGRTYEAETRHNRKTKKDRAARNAARNQAIKEGRATRHKGKPGNAIGKDVSSNAQKSGRKGHKRSDSVSMESARTNRGRKT